MNREDFALAYSVMQVGRTIFLGSTPPGRTMARLNAVPILIWLVVSAIFWVAGGFPGGQSRLVLWAMARDRISVASGAVLGPEIRRLLF